jgi:hypothetical protein
MATQRVTPDYDAYIRNAPTSTIRRLAKVVA